MATAVANPLTSLLSRFGVNYPDAPKPTPALLAFMRGLGMSMDTVEDTGRKSKLRLNERAVQAREEITRQNDRSLERLAGSAVSSGTLSSGQTNKAVGRQAEDYAKQVGDVEQTLAEGVDNVESGISMAGDQNRQQALEKVLGVETSNAEREAASKAQEQSWQRQEAATEKSYQRSKTENAAALAAQEAMMRKYGFI